MTSCRLLLLDLDGTLAGQPAGYRAQTIRLIPRLQQLGIAVGIATARGHGAALAEYRSHGLDGPLITWNGAQVWSAPGQLLEEWPMSPQAVVCLLDEADALGLFWKVGTGDIVLSKGPRTLRERFSRKRYSRRCLREGEWDGSLRSAHAVWVRGPATAEILLRRRVEVCGWGVHAPSPLEAGTEFLAAGVEKGSAARWLASHLGIPVAGVTAVGDWWNDLTLLEAVGTGVALADAPLPVQRAARLLAPCQRDGGVAAVLEALLLAGGDLERLVIGR